MSEGPIRLWRQAWVAPVVSIPDSERVCYPWPPTGTVACGRRKTPPGREPAPRDLPGMPGRAARRRHPYTGAPPPSSNRSRSMTAHMAFPIAAAH